MPPPAEGFAVRLILGPALRTQPDRRLVTLVREGFESAFEEIVRRYGKPLARYAAAIVGSRGEDVTQDAFSKALLALRRNDAEIELRPWLFRIVRNTALNDLRDRPPTPELLAEEIADGEGPAEELERREELADLMRRLQSLPERQRAAIVMRELEGLSHEEIAAALGLSDGAARQAIYRARQALRGGFGLLLPLPLLRVLIDQGGELAATGAGAGGAAAASGAIGGAGAGVALKAATATVLVAGAIGAGAAVDHNRHDSQPEQASAASVVADNPSRGTGAETTSANSGRSGANGSEQHEGHGESVRGNSGDSQSGNGAGQGGSHNGSKQLPGMGNGESGNGHRGGPHHGTANTHGGGRGASSHDDSNGDDGHQSGRGPGGSSGSGSGSSGNDGLDDNSGPGGGSLSPGGSSGPGSGDSGSPDGGDSNSGPGSGGDGGGSGDEIPVAEPVSADSRDSHSGDGFSQKMEPKIQEEP